MDFCASFFMSASWLLKFVVISLIDFSCSSIAEASVVSFSFVVNAVLDVSLICSSREFFWFIIETIIFWACSLKSIKEVVKAFFSNEGICKGIVLS